MSSEKPPQSPLEPGTDSPDFTSKPPGEPRSPFAPDYHLSEPADPRLGIVHLLVATACVAIYLGLEQTARGGLLLWVARRLRGMPFPRHPGEYMLVVEGILCLLFLGLGILWPLLNVMSERGLIYPWWSVVVFLYVIGALVWFVAGRWIGIRAWRRFFFLCAGARLVGACLDCGGLSRLRRHLRRVR